MYVNVEFLGDEPIENVITAMHFRMEKTICFGYPQTLEKHQRSTEHFLKKYCGVDDVAFHELAEWDLQSVLRKMREVLKTEYDAGTQSSLMLPEVKAWCW